MFMPSYCNILSVCRKMTLDMGVAHRMHLLADAAVDFLVIGARIA